MWEKLKALIDAATLTRWIIIMLVGFASWLMLIFTLEFMGLIDIDVQCGDRCMHLINSLFSLVKPASALDFQSGSPSAPLFVQVKFLP